MADRLINENAVMALIDARLEVLERLSTNAYAKAADRRTLATSISVLLKVKAELPSLPTEDYTEADKRAMLVDAAANENELAALQEIADAEGWEA